MVPVTAPPAVAAANAAAPHRPPLPLVTVGIELETDTPETKYFMLTASGDVLLFLKGFRQNNRDAFITYTNTQLEKVRSRCSTASAAHRCMRGGGLADSPRCMLAAARSIRPCCVCVCAQIDCLIFSVLKTGKTLITTSFDAGRHAISVLGKRGSSLVVNYTVLSRRNDNFATEMMNIYKTAIGQPLFVDAPPCRTRLRVRRTACLHAPLCAEALSVFASRCLSCGCALASRCLAVTKPAVRFYTAQKFNPSPTVVKMRKLYDGKRQRVGGSENAFLAWSGDDQFDQKAADAVLNKFFGA